MKNRPSYDELKQRVDMLEKEAGARKRTEADLVAIQELLRATLESTQSGVLGVDAQGKVIYSNTRFEKMWRIPDGIMESGDDRRLLDHVLPQLVDPSAFLSKVEKLYQSAKEDLDTLYFKDGRVFQRHSRPLMRSDKPAGRVWNFTDITELKRAEKTLQKQTRYLDSLYETGLGVINRLDPDELLETIINSACELSDTSHGFLYLVEPDGAHIRMCFGSGGIFDRFKDMLLAPGQGLAGMVWQKERPISVKEYHKWRHRLRDGPLDAFQAIAGIPIKSGRRIIGVIGLGHTESNRAFGREDIDIFSRFAQLAAIALDNARLYKDVRQALKEREQAQRKIGESQKLLDSILRASQVGIAVLENRVFKWVNDSMLRLFGYDHQEQMIGQTTRMLFDSEEEYRKAGGIYRGLSHGEASSARDIRYKRRDGTMFDALVTVAALDPGHPEKHAVATFADISWRKRIETELRDSQNRLDTILQSIHAGVIIIDPRTHTVSDINQAALELIGAAREDVMGRVCRGFVCPDQVDECPITDLRPGDHCERVLLTIDGREIPILKTVKPIVIDNQEYLLESFIDISDLKAAEREAQAARTKAEAASRVKSQFLANMSHEIRTPMNAVIGFTEMLTDTSLDEDQADYVRTIAVSGNSLLSLIDDILDFSKVEAGELELETIDFDPELLVYDVCNLTRPRMAHKPVELLCRIDSDLPSRLQGDPARVRQVLVNFMGNAVKFTDSGEIEISLQVAAETATRVKLKAAVRDSGIGIAAEKQAAIFEPFQQADDSTTRKFGGTGLGLSICKQIAGLMEGRVWVESPAGPPDQEAAGGAGSIFYFTCWLRKSADLPPKRSVPVSLGGKRALLVDDNPTNLRILSRVLARAGMQVETINRPDRVLAALEAKLAQDIPFDVCLLDIQMPEISGYEVARRIRGKLKGSAQLPLIAVSSMMNQDAKRCQAAGFNGFLSKPIQREKLYRLLENVLASPAPQTARGQIAGVTPPEPIMTDYRVREEMKRAVRILLVEDNAVNRKLARIMLTKGGYNVETAHDGRQAVEKFTASADGFDVILMDIQMPVMDGMEATAAIRKWEREHHKDRVPILAMTAHALKGYREKCIAADMDDYLTKPINRRAVFEKVDLWVFKTGQA